MGNPVTATHDHEAIWLKAKTFVNRSFSALDDGDESLAMLWAAISLELLAKSALCRINPLLVADPSDDGKSLLLAAGLPGDATRYRSVPAKALFSRCDRAFRTFDAKTALSIADQRNAELHSGALPYASIPDPEIWWERFWATAEVLIVSQHRSLEDLVGPLRLDLVQVQLDRNTENVRRRVDSLMDAVRQRLDLGATPTITVVGSSFSTDVDCPVCRNPACIYGDEVADSEVVNGGDFEDPWPLEVVTVWTDAFACGTCGLSIKGEAYVTAAGFPESFDDEREYEPDYGDYYGND